MTAVPGQKRKVLQKEHIAACDKESVWSKPCQDETPALLLPKKSLELSKAFTAEPEQRSRRGEIKTPAAAAEEKFPWESRDESLDQLKKLAPRRKIN